MTTERRCVALLVGLTALASIALPVFADSAATSDVARSARFQEWSQLYEELNGDRQVAIYLHPSRAFATERIAGRGYVELDLIAGKAKLEFEDLDRAVDVYVLDNKPGPGRVMLPEKGDILLHLARLEPAADGTAISVERDYGADFFRGVEVNWVWVSKAGVAPAKSRLLLGARSYFEILYTRNRLAREGFAAERLPAPAGLTKLRGEAAEAFDPAVSAEVKPRFAEDPHPVLVSTGLVSQDVFEGGEVFFDETFEGNGRSCGTCHPAENNQTIDPAFIATLPASNPLFVAEQRPPYDPISQLERPELMRNFALILENVDGLEDPNVKFLMRSVPHSLSLSTSISAPLPNATPFENRTGWSGDGAPPPGRLIEFLLGAIIQHYPNNSLDRVFKEDIIYPGQPFDFRMPTDKELFVTNEFSLNAGRTADVNLAAMTMANANVEVGRVRFVNSGCNFCHTNAGANTPPPPAGSGANNNFNTRVELLDNPAQGFMGINFPLDGGFGGQGLPAPNFDCDNDGIDDCFGDGTFNSTPLVEAADTGPFFHNDAITTIEDAVRFYTQPPFTGPNGEGAIIAPAEVDDVAAFLRVLNASFNLAMTIQRIEGMRVIDPEADKAVTKADFIGIRGTSNKLLLLANLEAEDALDVLKGSPLGNLSPSATSLIDQGMAANKEAINQSSTSKRAIASGHALFYFNQAKAALGTGIDFQLGSGNLLF